MQIVDVYNVEKLSVRELAARFKIGKTQPSVIIKKREELAAKWQSNTNVNQKRSFFKTEGLNIDKLCYDWFIKARSMCIPISGPKAKEIAERLGYNKFSASDGWLHKFINRHNIKFKAVSGEAASVNSEDVQAFFDKVPTLLRGYSPQNVYNADETGLFFRALPDKTLVLKSEKCTGGKMSKERLTVLHCVSVSGEKEPVIGKAARPRAFKKLNVNSLPVTWKFNKKAWMIGEIMTEWLLQFDRKIGLQKRKIVLFMDNAGSHPRDLKLTNIKIIFLPPNTTSFCQPLDQGIIQNFKTFYRTLILKHILSKVDSINSASELSKSIDLLEAIYFVKKAWQQVSSTTIMNCFPKSGSRHNDVHEVNDEFDTEDDLPLSVIAELCKCIQDSRLSHHDTNNLDNFINIDEALTTEDNNVDVSGTDLVRQDDGTLVELKSDDEDTEELEDMDETDDQWRLVPSSCG
ncbi:hypothetical protein GEV33_005556 [Tenebrio molitor]|uniref:HTH CENPB-type domain-containing protein n=1 Tax=Tenebrio molitor TaxID=7067 RepID=A0A8J6LDT6_TENMO|nr:hypothetical protein GEV33_005556 [Tenebrio molitor]